MRVLIVEDDDLRRFRSRRLLELHGCAVLEATTGEQALALLRSATAPLVVLLDYLLPEMHDYRLLHQVAADPDLAERHLFLVMSAHPLLVEQPLPHLGGRWMRLLRKPLDIAVFRTTVALANRRPSIHPSMRVAPLPRADAGELRALSAGRRRR
jgi:CheY-like chemotaxis protein